jgi:GntR family transcriptional repressor for pyruvate dehydrogenase complex
MSDAPLFAPVRRTRAYEAIVAQVEMAIRNGDLMPGDRLPSERELMRQF